MARPLRTAAFLSLCAILVPTGCDSPISPPDIAPSAAVTANGTVVTTVKDAVSVEGVVVSGQCLNDFEPFVLSGEVGIVHRMTLTPTSGGKAYLMNLDTQVWSQGIRGVGLQSGAELVVVGGDELEVSQEDDLPTVAAVEPNMGNHLIGVGTHGLQAPESFTRTFLAIEIAEDFGITTTVEDVQLVCPSPSEPDGGTIVITVPDKLSVDTEVTTGCFNDGMEEVVKVSGVLGVLNHLKLTPIVGTESYLMDLSMVAWSEGIQVVGMSSAAEGLAVGVEKLEVVDEVMVPTPAVHPILGPWLSLIQNTPHGGDQPPNYEPPSVSLTRGIEITEDFGITTTLDPDKTEIICSPPPVVDN